MIKIEEFESWHIAQNSLYKVVDFLSLFWIFSNKCTLLPNVFKAILREYSFCIHLEIEQLLIDKSW